MDLIKPPFIDKETGANLYFKTIGEAITTKLPDGTLKILDTAWKEMEKRIANGIFPIGELKSFACKNPIFEYLESLGQEWVIPEGQLLNKANYPELFALIGYNYGWGDTNPYSGDLDAQGNAIATNSEHIYFRLPDFSACFLRVAGEKAWTNTWTDSDGVSHSLQTTYKAEMYKRKLDAIRNISGRAYFRTINTSDRNFIADCSGAVRRNTEYWSGSHDAANVKSLSSYYWEILNIESSRITPNDIENVVINSPIKLLIRLS